MRFYAAIAALLLASAGVWYYGHTRFNAGVDHQVQLDVLTAAVNASAAQTRTLQADAGAKAATDAGQVQIAQNEAATHETVRVITKVVHDHPADPVCRVPADSLSALQRAADAANAAASQLPISRAK